MKPEEAEGCLARGYATELLGVEPFSTSDDIFSPVDCVMNIKTISWNGS